MKNVPSNLGSRARRARSQIRASSSIRFERTPVRAERLAIFGRLRRPALDAPARRSEYLESRTMNVRSAAAAFGLAAAVLGAPAAAGPTDAPPCSAPEYRQFDFWLGDWDAYDADALDTPTARVRVDAILGGCAVHETYTGVN